jgi:hypothetical protein
MGLFVIRMRFDSVVPSESVLRSELLRQAGAERGLDSFEIRDNIVQITTTLDPVTRPYAIKVLVDLGGVYLDFGTGEPRDPQLPEYVRQPWRAWPWWTRARILTLFHLGLLSTALPRDRHTDR